MHFLGILWGSSHMHGSQNFAPINHFLFHFFHELFEVAWCYDSGPSWELQFFFSISWSHWSFSWRCSSLVAGPAFQDCSWRPACYPVYPTPLSADEWWLVTSEVWDVCLARAPSGLPALLAAFCKAELSCGFVWLQETGVGFTHSSVSCVCKPSVWLYWRCSGVTRASEW